MIEQRNNTKSRKRIRERSTPIKKHNEYVLAREYTVGEMIKYMRKSYDIDFHNIDYKMLKTKAIGHESYLIDISCDIKELLTSSNDDKYYYIDILLSEFKKEIRN